MNVDTIFGMLITTVCSFLCAAIFYGIGIWSAKRDEPMHFYSGTTLDPNSISDVTAYNLENAKMWKTFSIQFWLSGLCGALSLLDNRLSTVSIALLVAGCSVGIVWLVRKYHRILKKYLIR